MQPFEPQQLPSDGIQWDSVIPLIGKENGSLAYYDGIPYGLANPDVLLSALTTHEAVLSSKIEGTQATLGEEKNCMPCFWMAYEEYSRPGGNSAPRKLAWNTGIAHRSCSICSARTSEYIEKSHKSSASLNRL